MRMIIVPALGVLLAVLHSVSNTIPATMIRKTTFAVANSPPASFPASTSAMGAPTDATATSSATTTATTVTRTSTMDVLTVFAALLPISVSAVAAATYLLSYTTRSHQDKHAMVTTGGRRGLDVWNQLMVLLLLSLIPQRTMRYTHILRDKTVTITTIGITHRCSSIGAIASLIETTIFDIAGAVLVTTINNFLHGILKGSLLPSPPQHLLTLLNLVPHVRVKCVNSLFVTLLMLAILFSLGAKVGIVVVFFIDIAIAGLGAMAK